MAATKRNPRQESETIEPLVIERGRIVLGVFGETPLLFNRQSEKVRQGLLLPPPRRNRSERESTLKHDPFQEFADSPYTLDDPTAPTLLALKASAFKGAIASAALDMPGMQRSQIGRLVWVEGELLPVYGVPELHMATVKQAGITGAPDIRTRAIVPRWACVVTVTYMKPLLTEKAVAHLAAAAGMFIGVGDGRPEKGKLAYGRFELVAQDHPEFVRLLKVGGRRTQEAAMKAPKMYDKETADLFAWFQDEVERRGREKQLAGASTAARAKRAVPR